MGLSGGLLLLWDLTKENISLIGKDLHTLRTGWVQVFSNNAFFLFFSSIYASTKFKHRKVTWAAKDMTGGIDLPWLLIGDLNESCNQSEKLGVTPLGV